MDQYSTFFLTFVDDVNGDGRPDVIADRRRRAAATAAATPNAFWYANPGPANLGQPWTKTRDLQRPGRQRIAGAT